NGPPASTIAPAREDADITTQSESSDAHGVASCGAHGSTTHPTIQPNTALFKPWLDTGCLMRVRLEQKSDGKQAFGRLHGGFSSKIQGLADSLGNPVHFALTAGRNGDASQALLPLLEQVDLTLTRAALADRAYDSNEIITSFAERGIEPVIPPNPGRIEQRQTDWSLYKERNKIEVMFGFMKHYRRVFFRFEKLYRRFFAFVHFVAACVLLR
ncbi:MAG: transposase, partial [Rhizobiaceae bacterium]